jgi:uncharacterized protein
MNDLGNLIEALVVKVAERCNLNCSYCYVYNHEDKTYMTRPSRMRDEIFEAMLMRALHYCKEHSPHSISITFHGGEPTLLGARCIDEWAGKTEKYLGDYLDSVGMQTNGTLLDADWIDVIKRHNIRVGVSMDGPAHVHDQLRVDHAGRGSHKAVLNGLALLLDAGLDPGLLCVLNPWQSGEVTYRYFRSLGLKRITFLLPDVSHDNKQKMYGALGATPVADFLIPVFDAWWSEDDPAVRVRPFWGLIRTMLGGHGETDAFGNPPMQYLIIESDGSIETLDALRVCANNITGSGLNVLQNEFDELKGARPLVYQLLRDGMPLSKTCLTCTEQQVCGGGYLPHRYASANGFDNPSVWCADILKLLAHIRNSLNAELPVQAISTSSSVLC